MNDYQLETKKLKDKLSDLRKYGAEGGTEQFCILQNSENPSVLSGLRPALRNRKTLVFPTLFLFKCRGRDLNPHDIAIAGF